MKKSLTLLAITMLLGTASVSYAYGNQRSTASVWKPFTHSFINSNSAGHKIAKGNNQHATSTPVKTTPAPVPKPVTPTTTPVASLPSGIGLGETRMVAYTTGYSYWDNTPAGSAEISNPVLHKKAGGSGTYADPLTLAVGHSIIGGKDILDYPQGTRFYVPNVRKYFIVEDTCGDGNNPQNGPCHTGYQGHVWLDLYVNGASASRSQSDSCMNAITDIHTVIQNPASNYVAVAGDLSANCKQYSEVVVTQ